jgi:uncharacterized membrane protein
MTALILGLVIFLGGHSVRLFADGWRSAQIARIGALRWKAIYALVSLAGLALIVWGYGLARADPVIIWHPPDWTRHVTALLVVLAFVLIAAAYVPGTRMRAAIGHPMLAGVKLWAAAHLLSNGSLGAIALFGTFLIWSVADFIASRRRDRALGIARPAGSLARDALAAVIGVAAALVFALYLHGPLIGVRPFG